MATNKTCSICLEESSGCHFGAEACRACAAFFRRSVTQNKKYACRGNNDCDIAVNIRCMCRACRYSKCIESGMNPVGVQQRPENIRKPMSKPKRADFYNLTLGSNEPSTSTLLLEDPPSSFNDQIPILTKMKANYQKMRNARLVLYKKDGQNLFEERIPRSINYLESVEQGMKDVGLVADWISWCFPDFVDLAVEQKNILFRNFYTKFCQLEVTFMSHIRKTSDAIVLPSGDYIDMNNLDKFYFDPGAVEQMTREEIERLFKPTYDLQRKSLILPMMSYQLDIFELFALISLLLWDIGLEGQTEDCQKIGQKIKDDVISELILYMKHAKNIEEPGIRIASIVNLLPAVERCVRRFQDDMEMTQVFNVFKSSKEFYDLVNGNFC